MSKQTNEVFKPVLQTHSRTESQEVVSMEYVVKRYIANVLTLAENDTIGSTNPLKDYAEEITAFIAEYNLSRLFVSNFNRQEAVNLWNNIRSRDEGEAVTFLLNVTSEYRMLYTPEEYMAICHKVADSIDYTRDNELSIIHQCDSQLSKLLGQTYSREDTAKWLNANAWLVSLYLITLMNPLGK